MLSTLEFTQSLGAVLLILISAHLFAYWAEKIKQPPVIGEIVGGLVLGPTILGFFFPDIYQFLFYSTPRIQLAWSFIYNFGLLLLMFCSGMELGRQSLRPAEKRISLRLALFGTLLPATVVFIGSHFVDFSTFFGEVQNALAFSLVLIVGVSVTSLPVISRIFLDLGLIKTSFAKIIIGASLIDDFILYIVLSTALSLVFFDLPQEKSGILALLPTLSLELRVLASTLLNLGYMVISLFFGPAVFRFLAAGPARFFIRRSPIAFLLFILLFVSSLGMLIGIPSVLAAFVGGIIASSITQVTEEERHSLKTFSLSFFIPIYFAVVGFRLDLTSGFPILYFALFFFMASFLKFGAIFLGAVSAGLPRSKAVHFGMVMNARGGPGIVLASVALDSKIINLNFYAVLVLLAVLSSSLAGSWLHFNKEKVSGAIS